MTKKDLPNFSSPLFWTTAAWNIAAVDMWMDRLMTMAISRFRWEGLPPSVDTRFLEWTLLTENQATLAWPHDFNPANMLAMRAVPFGRPNANNNYPRWHAMGVNGMQFPVRHNVNGVYIWDNVTRTPIMPRLQFIASELAGILRTIHSVRQHMQQPVIIQGPREQAQQLRNLAQQTANGAPYIITYNGFDTVKTEVLPIASSNEGQELASLQDQLNDMWNIGLAYIGIGVSERKMERQSAAEIAQSEEPSTLQGLGALLCRRRAADELTRITGHPVHVYWNSDVESNTFNTLEDAGIMLGVSAPATPDPKVVPGV